jgi:subtilisin family serine protease
MCDTVPGGVLLLHDAHDPIGVLLNEFLRSDQGVPGVIYDRNLDDDIQRRELSVPDGFGVQLHRLEVPEGEEAWKINSIFGFASALRAQALLGDFGEEFEARTSDWHRRDRVLPMMLAQEHVLTFQQTAQLTPEHAHYKAMLGLPPMNNARGTGARVAIIDSGLDPSAGIVPVLARNWADDAAMADASDLLGHGTGVAAVLADVAPDAEIEIHKVSDRPRIPEYAAALAMVAAAPRAAVVNMSLAFGLEERDCPRCGRQSHSVRSGIFETLLDRVAATCPDTIVVAAAGNKAAPELTYPARFAGVVAVGSVDGKGDLSAFSNHGTENHLGQPHEAVFYAPGGQRAENGVGADEYVVETTVGGTFSQHRGTSFSAPYVSGVIALLQGGPGSIRERKRVLRLLGTFAQPGARRIVGMPKLTP